MPINYSFKGTICISILALFFFLSVFSSCNNSRISKLNEKEVAYVGKIKISAGDDIDYIRNDTLGFMAFPMNVAIFKGSKKKDVEVYVVGKAIGREKSIKFVPFAKLTFTDKNNETFIVIVARPQDAELITTKIDNYIEFISVNYGVQQVLETWIKNVKGFGSVKNIVWENEEKAIEFLEM